MTVSCRASRVILLSSVNARQSGPGVPHGELLAGPRAVPPVAPSRAYAPALETVRPTVKREV
jgi:hypothetical protein